MVGDLSFSEPLIENSSAVAEMGESLATTDIPMGRKLGAVPLWGSWVPITMWPGLRPTRTKWHLDPWSRLASIHGP